MRTLRTRTVGILAALLVLIWAGAASASTVSFIWTGTSGAGVGVGTSTLTGVSVGDTATLDIVVLVDGTWAGAAVPGIEAIGVRATYDPTVIFGTGLVTCPPSGNNFFGPASCGGFGTNIGGAAGFLGVLPGSSLNGPGGLGAQSGLTVAAGVGGGQANGSTFVLGTVTFTAVGSGLTGGGFFVPGVDGEIAIGGTFGFPVLGSMQISVIPEPGTFAMLALGLGALAFAGRRR